MVLQLTAKNAHHQPRFNHDSYAASPIEYNSDNRDCRAFSLGQLGSQQGEYVEVARLLLCAKTALSLKFHSDDGHDTAPV